MTEERGRTVDVAGCLVGAMVLTAAGYAAVRLVRDGRRRARTRRRLLDGSARGLQYPRVLSWDEAVAVQRSLLSAGMRGGLRCGTSADGRFCVLPAGHGARHDYGLSAAQLWRRGEG